MVGGADGDVVVVEPEVDLVARLDAQLVSQLLGDDDLPLGTDTVSHTEEYNLRERPASPQHQGCSQRAARAPATTLPPATNGRKSR